MSRISATTELETSDWRNQIMRVPRLIVTLCALACTLSPALNLQGQRTSEAQLLIQHSKAVDVMMIMDNVSNWRPGWNQHEYADDWVRRFGPLSKEDKLWIERYSEFRRRTWQDPDAGLADSVTGPDGIFIKRSSLQTNTDPLAAYFKEEPDCQSALDGLPKRFGPKDGDLLQGFYRHFFSRWELLIADREPLDKLANRLQNQVSTSEAVLYRSHVQKFYGTKVDGIFQVYVVWWPVVDYTAGKSRGGSLYLQVNPAQAANDDLDAIIFHEYAHFISAHVDQTTKQQLSQQFLQGCPLSPEKNYLAYLEEPLAVTIGNAAYAEFVRKQPLKLSDDWYFDAKTDILAKLIWPVVQADWRDDETIRSGIVPLTSSFCNRLRSLGPSF